MDISHLISESDSAQCCPLCDDAIVNGESSEIVTAHGAVILVHSSCLDDLCNDDEAAEPSDG